MGREEISGITIESTAVGTDPLLPLTGFDVESVPFRSYPVLCYLHVPGDLRSGPYLWGTSVRLGISPFTPFILPACFLHVCLTLLTSLPLTLGSPR